MNVAAITTIPPSSAISPTGLPAAAAMMAPQAAKPIVE